MVPLCMGYGVTKVKKGHLWQLDGVKEAQSRVADPANIEGEGTDCSPHHAQQLTSLPTHGHGQLAMVSLCMGYGGSKAKKIHWHQLDGVEEAQSRVVDAANIEGEGIDCSPSSYRESRRRRRRRQERRTRRRCLSYNEESLRRWLPSLCLASLAPFPDPHCSVTDGSLATALTEQQQYPRKDMAFLQKKTLKNLSLFYVSCV